MGQSTNTLNYFLSQDPSAPTNFTFREEEKTPHPTVTNCLPQGTHQALASLTRVYLFKMPPHFNSVYPLTYCLEMLLIYYPGTQRLVIGPAYPVVNHRKAAFIPLQIHQTFLIIRHIFLLPSKQQTSDVFIKPFHCNMGP